MGRLDRPVVSIEPGPVVVPGADSADLRERLGKANDEIARLEARLACLEQGLEAERSARLEAGAMLTSERLRTRELHARLGKREDGSEGNARVMRELEAAWAQIRALQAALERRPRWWRGLAARRS